MKNIKGSIKKLRKEQKSLLDKHNGLVKVAQQIELEDKEIVLRLTEIQGALKVLEGDDYKEEK